MWPSGIVPYRFDVTMSDQGRRKIVQDSMAYISSKATCITFENIAETGRDTPDYVLIREGTECDSQLGRVGKVQHLNLNKGCFRDGMLTPTHELMHTLGFLHEQSRPDRDNFIKVNTANIEKGKQGNFKRREYGNAKFFDPTFDNGTVVTNNSPYDVMSVLHYGPKDFSKNGQDVFTFNHDLPGEEWNEPLPDDPLSLIDQVGKL
jgi:hypothetical protein